MDADRARRGWDGQFLWLAKRCHSGRIPHGQAIENEAIFVNAAHDFPQRVRYLRTTTGIDAEVSLADGSKPVRWSYRRSGSPTVK